MTARKDLVAHCLTYADAYEDYPFYDPNWTVMRHRGNKKVFALIYDCGGGRMAVNLKCEVLLSPLLRENYKDVTAGYHMNKKHWNTVLTGGDVPEDELKKLIALSFALTAPRAKKPVRKQKTRQGLN
jgi:predicted DNA-binding protein (MmcQ/YjbR family)